MVITEKAGGYKRLCKMSFALLGQKKGKGDKVKTIELSRGKHALVDDEDYLELSKFTWSATNHGTNSYAEGWITRKKIRMHRFLLNAPTGLSVDHINGNGLDNRRSNLRMATSSENSQNMRKLRNDSKTGIRGVSWNKNAKKFSAQIHNERRKEHLGYFNVLGDADSAYRKAEDKYFGEFSRSFNPINIKLGKQENIEIKIAEANSSVITARKNYEETKLINNQIIRHSENALNSAIKYYNNCIKERENHA